MPKLTLLCLCFGFVVSACNGKLPPQESVLASEARDLIQEKEVILQELSSVEEVSEAWADIELAQYESRLNRLSEIDTQLSVIETKEGLLIDSPSSAKYVAHRLALLKEVRDKKALKTEVKKDLAGEKVFSESVLRHTFLDLRDKVTREDFIHPALSEEELREAELQLLSYQTVGQLYSSELQSQIKRLSRKQGDEEDQAQLELLQIQLEPAKKNQREQVVSSLQEKINSIRKDRTLEDSK